VFLTDDARIENARAAGERVDGWVDPAFDDLAAEVGGGVQVRKGGGGGRIGVIVGRDVDGLHGSDGSGFGGGDAFLQFSDFGVEVGLVSDSGRHAAE